MKQLFTWLDNWLWRLDQKQIDQRLQAHFSSIHPDSIVDIDKYLKSHHLMP
jgi:hypothetical protein